MEVARGKKIKFSKKMGIFLQTPRLNHYLGQLGQKFAHYLKGLK